VLEFNLRWLWPPAAVKPNLILERDERERNSPNCQTPLRQRATEEHPPRKPGLYGWYRPGLFFAGANLDCVQTPEIGHSRIDRASLVFRHFASDFVLTSQRASIRLFLRL
jgi:hypothetical protein